MTLYILVGAPGSGKSYYAKHNLNDYVYISRDEVRFSMITDEDDYFSKEKQVYKEYVRRIKEALLNKDNKAVVADATHLNWPSRRKLLYSLEEIILMNDIKVIPIVIQASLKTILKRNAGRTGRARVPADNIIDMYDKMTDPKNDVFHYNDIIYVNAEENK